MSNFKEWFSGLETFETKNGILVHGDAREVVKRIPSEAVDSIITDPPWGVGFDGYDDLNAFLQMREDLYRVAKSDSWFAFFFTPKQIFSISPLLEKFKYKWIIPYVFNGFSTARNPFGDQMSYSIIMVFAKGTPKVVKRRTDIIYADELPVVDENPREPQFKPTYTVSVLLSMFSRSGDLILDPFAGYGSIPFVSELFNRKWIGIEIDPAKFRVAKRILSEMKVGNIKKMKEEEQG
jgi:DNA modification methylase